MNEKEIGTLNTICYVATSISITVACGVTKSAIPLLGYLFLPLRSKTINVINNVISEEGGLK